MNAAPLAPTAPTVPGTAATAAPATALIALSAVRKSYRLGLPSEAEVLHGLDLQVALIASVCGVLAAVAPARRAAALDPAQAIRM